MVSLEQLVSAEHVYRKFMKLLDFTSIAERLQKLENNQHHGAKGYDIEILFRCLLLQFIEDLSDRELEKMLQENTAAKYFCGFRLCEVTPDFSLFSKTRKKIGPEELGALFAKMRDQLRAHGYMNKVFNFVDASHLVSKAALWEERDEAIKKRYEALNNQTLPKVAKDKQARFGCKGGTQFWYGYKEHVSMDMQNETKKYYIKCFLHGFLPERYCPPLVWVCSSGLLHSYTGVISEDMSHRDYRRFSL